MGHLPKVLPLHSLFLLYPLGFLEASEGIKKEDLPALKVENGKLETSLDYTGDLVSMKVIIDNPPHQCHLLKVIRHVFLTLQQCTKEKKTSKLQTFNI